MKLRSVLVWALAALLPAVAAAQQARAMTTVALRAGPDREYPFVVSYGPGTPLAVQGCTDGYGWCDVIGPNGYRGWVYAGDIAYPYERREVPVLGYGTMIGIPIITFALGSYWASNYHDRTWYRDRDRWDRYRPVYRPVRPPPGRPGYDRPGYDRPGHVVRPDRPGGPNRPDRPDRPGRPDSRPDRPQHHDRDNKLPRGGVVGYENGKPAVVVKPPTRARNAPAPERGQQ